MEHTLKKKSVLIYQQYHYHNPKLWIKKDLLLLSYCWQTENIANNRHHRKCFIVTADLVKYYCLLLLLLLLRKFLRQWYLLTYWSVSLQLHIRSHHLLPLARYSLFSQGASAQIQSRTISQWWSELLSECAWPTCPLYNPYTCNKLWWDIKSTVQ